MASLFSCSSLPDLCINRTILDCIEGSLNNPNFRNLFSNFANQDGNLTKKRHYEEQLQIAIQKEHGVDVDFVHPIPGYVIQINNPKENPVFINICTSELVTPPRCIRKVGELKELQWNIPHCLTFPYFTLDNSFGAECAVHYDAVIHPDALYLGQKNVHFGKLIEDIICKSIEAKFHLNLDYSNIIYPKLSYKGPATPDVCIINVKCDKDSIIGYERRQTTSSEIGPVTHLEGSVVIAPDEEMSSDLAKNSCGSVDNKPNTKDVNISVAKKSCSIAPKYRLIYAANVDSDNRAFIRQAHMESIEAMLIAQIKLPLIRCSSDLFLNILQEKLTLVSKETADAFYNLEVDLPHFVEHSRAFANFDESNKLLHVILPLKKALGFENPSLAGEKKEEVRKVMTSTNSATVISEDEKISPDGSEAQYCKILYDDLCSVTDSLEVHMGFDPDHACGLGMLCHPSADYEFPVLNHRQSAESVVLVLGVKNVDSSSLRTLYCTCGRAFQIIFNSSSRCDDGSHLHSFCCRFDQPYSDVRINVTCDNIVVSLTKCKESSEMWEHFWAGTTEGNLTQFEFLSEKAVLKKVNHTKEETEEFMLKSDPIDAAFVHVLEVTPEVITFDIQLASNDDAASQKTRSVIPDGKTFSDSEEGSDQGPLEHVTHCDKDNASQTREMVCKTQQPEKFSMCQVEVDSEDQQRLSSTPPKRGILKYPRGWRTISESSDDFSWSSCDTMSPDIELGSSPTGYFGSPKPKKSVRFNDNVMKSIFRINSSILGQRKKNQRKANNRKKAAAKRADISAAKLQSENGEILSGESSSDELDHRQALREICDKKQNDAQSATKQNGDSEMSNGSLEIKCLADRTGEKQQDAQRFNNKRRRNKRSGCGYRTKATKGFNPTENCADSPKAVDKQNENHGSTDNKAQDAKHRKKCSPIIIVDHNPTSHVVQMQEKYKAADVSSLISSLDAVCEQCCAENV